MGENGSTYLGMKIAKVNNGEFGWVALDANNYEGRINHIEISHERTREPNEPSAEDKQKILRSELGKLIFVARIVSPGAIYDDAAAAQTFPDGGLMEVLDRGGGILENGEDGVPNNEMGGWFLNTCLVSPNLWGGFKRMLTR